MLHRLTSIPLNTHDYQEELNTIKYIAVKNGYNPDLVNKIHKRILNTKNKNKTHQTNNTQPSKYITLTYYNSNTHKIANTFRKHNYKVAYRTNNTIMKHLNINKDTDTYSKTAMSYSIVVILKQK